MMKKNLPIAAWLAIVLICSTMFQSCEFDSNDKNYVDVEKPKDTNIPIAIDLMGVKGDEVIQIPNGGELYYSLDLQGKKMIEIKYYWDGTEMDFNYAKNSLIIRVDQIDEKIHDLTMSIQLRSGNGSLADYALLERYVGEYTFKVRVIDTWTKHLNITQTVDANNNLKLEWSNPDNITVERYEVYDENHSASKLLATITDLSNLHFVDPEYVYGYKRYSVAAILKNSTLENIKETHYAEYKVIDFGEAQFEAAENNKIRITWTNPNPFPANFVVTESYNIAVIKDNSNTAEITRPRFPTNFKSYNIYILPKSEDPLNYKNNGHFLANAWYGDASYKRTFSMPYYDPNTNLLYGFTNHEILILDGTKGLAHINTIKLDESMSPRDVKTSNQGMVGILNWDNKLSLYTNNTLAVRSNIIPDVSEFSFGGNLLLTFANELDYTGTFLHKTSVYDISTAQKLFTIDGLAPKIYYSSSINPDGKYIYFCTTNGLWIKLYEIVNNQPVEKKLWQNVNFRGPKFNPANSSEIILIHRNKFEIIDLASLQVKASIEGVFIDIDSATGNLMYYTNNIQNITIVNKTYNKVLAELKTYFTSYYDNTKLYNNNLTHNGYITDYRKLIEK